jgi:septal ring factor EnvC (AmiA/AmiB activator)
MNDAVAEKLVQKVINMLEEMSDLNIQVRRLTPTQETFNRINERIDAILGAIKQTEKGISNDEKRIAELENQTKSVDEILSKLNGTMLELKHNTGEIRKGTLDIQQHAIGAGTSNESRFKQLADKLDEWFWGHKVALIALAVAQVVFLIVVLLR